jgi:hydroxymethylpyrimidine pyrophosphatase-like HAD family hydrolase
VIDQLYSYDPIFDLGVAAADHELAADPEKPSDTFQSQLISAYEAGSATSVQPERWFLYQLLHLFSHQRFVESLLAEVDAGVIPKDGLEALDAAAVAAMADRTSRAAARADQRYLAGTLLADTTCPLSGPLCALDIDGVLETGLLGYSSVTPTGAAALRRLMRHGCRPVIASGRSLGEVMDRCRAFGLAGGVAEYGAAIYDHVAGCVIGLLVENEEADLDRIRVRLGSISGVHVDSGYRRIVRASRLSGHSRKPLPQELVEEVANGTPINAVHGLAQTDIVPARINKGRGVRVLAERLSRDGLGTRPPLAFAIGDSFADLSLFEEAGARFAPANADQAVLASGARIMRGYRQAGLAEAISLFLEHEPGGCETCRVPRLSRDASLLVTALSAGGAGRWKKMALGFRLALQARR